MTEQQLGTTHMQAGAEGPATRTVAPRGGWITAARIWHLVVALIGTASFLVSCTLAMTNEWSGGPFNGLWFSLSYFTVWSNVLVAITNWMLFANPQRDGRVFRWFRMTTLVMIVITGLVYALVLAAKANPTGLYVYTNIGYHYIVPWATLAGFLLFGPRPRFTLRHVFLMVIVPIIWLTYTLLRGLMMLRPPGGADEPRVGEPQNWYPYPFIDVNDPSPLIPGLEGPGYTGVAYNIVAILILGLVFAFIFLGLDRLLSGGKKPTDLIHPQPEQVGAQADHDANTHPDSDSAPATTPPAPPTQREQGSGGSAVESASDPAPGSQSTAG